MPKQPDLTAVMEAPFHLEQNFPNPFNMVTRISYFLPRVVAVEINIYSVDGRRIKTVLESSQPVGKHATYWDAAGNASGI